jgi:hypothetical protein
MGPLYQISGELPGPIQVVEAALHCISRETIQL